MATSAPSSPQSSTSSMSPQQSPMHQRRNVVQGIGKLDLDLEKASSLDHYDSENDVFEENRPLVGQKDHVRVAGERSAEPSPEGLIPRLKIAGYFVLWYALNVVYNILNKKVLNVLPAPLTVASIQLGVGGMYISILWALNIRPAPRLSPKGQAIVHKIGLYHALGQIFTVVSLGAGPVSFTHIVKALEPFFSAAVSVAIFGKWMRPQVYATLIPVVGGVSYACMKEVNFSWLALSTALGSNLAFALRAVMSKSAMIDYVGESVTPANLFGVVTTFSFILSVIPALIFEATSFWGRWADAVEEGGETTPLGLAGGVFLSGLFHYLNNEVMYLALGKVHPVTLAVGNTIKRVVIMVASVVVFSTPVTLQSALGSTVGILGVLLYSLTKQQYEKRDAAADNSATPSSSHSR